MQVTVELDSSDVRQLMLRDPYSNGWLDDDFIWRATVILKWEEKKLAFCVEAHSDTQDRTGVAKDAWSVGMLDAVLRAIKAGRFSAFSANDLTDILHESTTIKIEPQVVTVSEAFHQKLEQEYELDKQARRSFRHAVAQVRMEVGSLPHGSGEAGMWLAFIERMLQSADVGVESGWYREKVGGIRSYISDLSRRKNRNHHGFRTGLDYIYSNLSCFSPPTAWRERPAIVSTHELDRCGVA